MGKGTDLTKEEKREFGTVWTERRPEEIEADIEQTRAGLEGTVDEIQERFSSEHVKAQVRDATLGRMKRMMGATGQKVRHMGSDVIDSVKGNVVTRKISENPIPAALATIGIGWFIFNSLRRSNGYDVSDEYESEEYEPEEYESEEYHPEEYGTAQWGSEQPRGTFESVKESAGETVSRAREKAGEMMGHAKERAGEMMGQARAKAGQLRSEAQYRAHASKEWYQNTLQDRPLALLAGAFAVGLAVGLSIPETSREHELMGETKERLLGKAKEVAREKMEKVEHVALEAKKTAEEKAKQEGLLT